MTSAGARPRLGHADVVVVGAGVVGLAHAVAASARGASVTVVERDPHARGASVRNFGHGCVTAQAGARLRLATEARAEWLRLAKEAGFWLRDAGTVVVARADDEYEVLSDFAAERGEDVVLLDAAALRTRIPAGDGVVGGAWLPLDVRVDAREAIPAIARWLVDQGVEFLWSTSLLGIDAGDPLAVRTTRGDLTAGRVVVAVGHDVDRLYPDVAASAAVRRCALHMLEVERRPAVVVDPAVMTGHSLLRYEGFSVSPALDAVRRRLERDDPEATSAGLNLMYTQRPAGGFVVGDTHEYVGAVPPFRAEQRDNLVLERARHLLGGDDVAVQSRWRGVYASAPEPFLVATPYAGVRIVSVTSGIGMTTAFGLAPTVLDDLL